jgi:predicted dehydrogenase
MSRRRFLTLAAGLAVVPAAHASVQRVSSANDAIRIGVIGCGSRGAELTAGILDRASRGVPVRLAAVCDIYEPCKQRARAMSGADLHHRWQDLVERNDIDAVIIATPDHWHAPMAVAAMECGKDVYCEKPMALHVEEAKAFRDCALRTKRVVQIGAQQTSEPRWRAANAILREGTIGQVVWSQGSYARSGAGNRRDFLRSEKLNPATLDWQAFAGHGSRRAFDPDRYLHWRQYWDYSGGVATERLYHKLAALLVALGPEFPERVSAAGGIYVQDGREVPDSFVMTAEYPSGHTVVLASSMANRNGLPAVIRGTRGLIEIRPGGVRVIPETGPARADSSPPTGIPTSAVPQVTPMNTGEDHINNWLRCIRSREQCVCNEELGYRATVAIGMAIEAYRTGKTPYFHAGTETISASRSRNLTLPRIQQT